MTQRDRVLSMLGMAARAGRIESGEFSTEKAVKYDLATAEITMVPQNTVAVPAEKVEQVQRLIDRLEDEDDVSDVYTSAEFPDED